MRLLATAPSPYARKCRAAILELGLQGRVAVDLLEPRLPVTEKPDVEALNPLSKIPVLLAPEGSLIDSRVIVAFLNALAGGGLIAPGPERWRELALEALADGIADAGVVVRLERVRPSAEQRPAEIAAHERKIGLALDALEADPPAGERFHVGLLALVSTVEWLEFRGLMPAPLGRWPRVAALVGRWSERPSLIATRPA